MVDGHYGGGGGDMWCADDVDCGVVVMCGMVMFGVVMFGVV